MVLFLMLGTITSWDVLENSFAEKFIPNVFNFATGPPYSIWTQDNEVSDLEEKSNKKLKYFSKSIHTIENENETSNFHEIDFSFSYTPYEDLSSNNFEKEIGKPPPNAQEYFNKHAHVENVTTNDENPQEHWKQE
jgi:hypothetical protein